MIHFCGSLTAVCKKLDRWILGWSTFDPVFRSSLQETGSPQPGMIQLLINWYQNWIIPGSADPVSCKLESNCHKSGSSKDPPIHVCANFHQTSTKVDPWFLDLKILFWLHLRYRPGCALVALVPDVRSRIESCMPYRWNTKIKRVVRFHQQGNAKVKQVFAMQCLPGEILGTLGSNSTFQWICNQAYVLFFMKRPMVRINRSLQILIQDLRRSVNSYHQPFSWKLAHMKLCVKMPRDLDRAHPRSGVWRIVCHRAWIAPCVTSASRRRSGAWCVWICRLC